MERAAQVCFLSPVRVARACEGLWLSPSISRLRIRVANGRKWRLARVVSLFAQVGEDKHADRHAQAKIEAAREYFNQYLAA